MNDQDEFLRICFKTLSIFQENLFLAVRNKNAYFKEFLFSQLWLLKWCKIQSLLICIQSHLIYIQSHLMYIQSNYICSVSSYFYSVNLYVFKSHPIYIQSTYVYSVPSYMYSVLYVFSLILFIFSKLMCISHMLYLLNSHLLFVNMFNVLCVTLKNLIKICECMSYRTIFHKEIKQTNILSKRKI